MRSLLADTFPKTLLIGFVTFTLALAANSGESEVEVMESSTAHQRPPSSDLWAADAATDNILASIDTAPIRQRPLMPASSTGAGSGSLKRFGVMPQFGDLDTMVERRAIRVLTVYGPGRYFLKDGPRGTVQEYADKLQKVVNEAFKTGLLTVQVPVIPVARDRSSLRYRQATVIS